MEATEAAAPAPPPTEDDALDELEGMD